MALIGEQNLPVSSSSRKGDWDLAEYQAAPESKARLDPHALPRPLQIGRYEILDYLGHGGNGIVYKARHPVTGQEVALKVILPHKATGPAIADFLQEIKRLARFRHTGIASVLDADTFESNGEKSPYFTMELI